MFASPLKLVEDISALGALESFQLRLLACHALWLSPFFVRFCPYCHHGHRCGHAYAYVPRQCRRLVAVSAH